MRIYEKFIFALVILFAILSGVFLLLKINIGAFISIGLFIIGLVFLLVLHVKKIKKQRIVNEMIEPYANDRIQKTAKLLMEFEIDITDAQQLDNIISRSLNEQKMYDIWQGFRKTMGGVATYAFLPVVTIFFTALLDDTDWTALLKKSISVLLVCTVIVLIISALYMCFTSIFNPDIRNLDYFIRDVEDVKVFSKKMADFEDSEKCLSSESGKEN